ncbi:hypothetical protein WI90_21100 [Burkholderia ubonensis]|nr:hypothetical protein WI90_21100 [Burkholderia ubonensis]
MNWLPEYFAQRTSPLTLSLWAYPPLVLGPEGPIARPACCVPYPGINLIYTPAERITHGGRTYDLPARYDTAGPLETHAGGPGASGEAEVFFREISIYAPSTFNPDFLMTINGDLSFVPVFSPDGAPAFSGMCMNPPKDPAASNRMNMPWTFQGYLSI